MEQLNNIKDPLDLREIVYSNNSRITRSYAIPTQPDNFVKEQMKILLNEIIILDKSAWKVI
jgi:hypothetical protein